MIAKKIHYCWFGGKELPDSVKKCIESWKTHCPDYEIIRWDESNYDVNKIKYISEAYQSKKYAFVSDYARLDIIYNNGGIYLDTDVELLKSLDELLHHSCYLGCELSGEVATGLGFGAIKNHWFIKKNKEAYENKSFISNDNKIDLTTCVSITTSILNTYGLSKQDDIQQIKDIVIYSPEYFCPFSIEDRKLRITDRTFSIHHYDATWFSDNKYKRKLHLHSVKYKVKLRIFLDGLFGEGFYCNLKNKLKGR